MDLLLTLLASGVRHVDEVGSTVGETEIEDGAELSELPCQPLGQVGKCGVDTDRSAE